MKNLKKRLSKEPAWKILLASGAVTIPLALAVTVGTQWLGFGEPEWTDQAVPVEDQISFSEMAALLKASDPTDEVAVFAQKIMFRDASVAEDGEGFIKSAELNPYTTHLFGGDYSDIPAQVTSHNTSTGTLSGLLKAAFYLALLGLIGTQTGLFSFGANGRAMTVVNTRDLKTSLDDVAGLEIVRDELRDMVELIKAGDQVSALGATPPKGVLLQGPPGTGKTMLARALAKDAGVSFMTLDATRLNDRFVGVGPRRIADAFRRARKAAPCIVFIDELDSIGSRDANDGGEGVGAERTNLINAMLQQLDGLSGSEGVFVVAATNRAEAVDPALVRPGRIDRHISIGLPDRQARAEILMYHTRNMPLGGSIDLDRIAQSVPGMSGAKLAAMANEAAIEAAKEGSSAIEKRHFTHARARLLIGANGANLTLDAREREISAWHEAGHAVVATLLPDADPVEHVTILPFGNSLGHVLQTPVADRQMTSRNMLFARMVILAAGRAAEMIRFGADGVSTGAAGDIAAITDIATSMVTQWGMSSSGAGFHRITPSPVKGYPDAVNAQIAELCEQALTRAHALLMQHQHAHTAVAERLLADDTLTGAQVREQVEAFPADPSIYEKGDL